LVEIAQSLDCAEIDFVGHSISSMIGLLAAIQSPSLFKSQAMVAPSPRFLNDPASDYVGGFEPHDVEAYFEVMELNFVSWASSFAALAAGPDTEAAKQLYECFCNTDPRVIRTFAKITLEVDLRPQLSQFKGPSLIIQCLQDVLAPVGVGQFMQRQMVDSQLEVLDIQGHIPHLTHPEWVEQRLRRFWERAAA
jgi:sigma-B regulation protein RsbQ